MNSITWKSPSNIALVKYWGKHGNQLPKNPSISFTLKNSVTELNLNWSESKSHKFELSFSFDGQINEKFQNKIYNYILSLKNEFPYLDQYQFVIHSKNSFPHSAGIASSASSMSALALSLLSFKESIEGVKFSEQDFLKKASELARLGSGSASRSLYPGVVSWGAQSVLASTDTFAAPLREVHPTFLTYQDTIIVVDPKEKLVSSSDGHALMEMHPFAESRFAVAEHNIKRLVTAIKNGEFSNFNSIVESEALMLHALMMTSSSPYLLLRPATLFVIEKLVAFRNQRGIPITYTLDAGPNLHILYPEKIKSDVVDFIKSELEENGFNFKVIWDEVGLGPTRA